MFGKFCSIHRLTFVGTWGWTKMKNWSVWKKMCFLASLGPWKFHFCLRKQPKTAKWVRLWKKETKNIAWDVVNNHNVNHFFPKKFKIKKRISIGVKMFVQLIADNVYRSTLKKSKENEKWLKWQMMRMEYLKKNC